MTSCRGPAFGVRPENDLGDGGEARVNKKEHILHCIFPNVSACNARNAPSLRSAR